MGIFSRLQEMKRQASEARTQRLREKTEKAEVKAILAEEKANVRKKYESTKARLRKAKEVTSPIRRAVRGAKRLRSNIQKVKKARLKKVRRKTRTKAYNYFGGGGGGPFG